jgi:protein-S-isoprenylcysteine O-methyltransferase Ste14
MPSVQDTLIRHGLYAYVRYPIYAGGMVILVGLALLKPTTVFVLACGLCLAWLVVQARLEEIDLLQRLPAYREYMEEVPRFVPRLCRRGAETRVGNYGDDPAVRKKWGVKGMNKTRKPVKK